MGGPWEQYAAKKAPENGPWNAYAAPQPAPSGIPEGRKPSLTDWGQSLMSPVTGLIAGASKFTDPAIIAVTEAMGISGAKEAAARNRARYEQGGGRFIAGKAGEFVGENAPLAAVGPVLAAPVKVLAKVAPAVARYAAPVVAGLETGGFRTGMKPTSMGGEVANALVRGGTGATTGAATAVVAGQDPNAGAGIGAALPLVGVPFGKAIVGVADFFGKTGSDIAATAVKKALGPNATDVIALLNSAPEGMTAKQFLAQDAVQAQLRTMGVENPQIIVGLASAIEQGPKGLLAFVPILEQQAQARTNVLAAQAGGLNATAARTAQGEAKDTLNALTKPMLDAELGAANIGRIIPKLEAQAQQFGQEAAGAVDKVRTMMPFSEKMAEQGINPNMKKYVGSAPYDVLQTDAQRTAQYYAGRAENLGTDEAARSLTLGKASRDATQIAQNLRDAGLNPLDTKSLTGQLSQVLNDPNFAANEEVSRSVSKVIDAVQEWTAKGGGIIDARALYSIRKNAVNAAIRDLLGANASADAKARAAAGVMAEINPLIDKAIKTAGGEGWPEYLSAYSSGMKEIERVKLSAKAAEFLRNKTPDEFLKLVRGNNYEAVEEIFGAGSFDIFKEMDQKRLAELQKVAGELELDARAGELAATGAPEALELLKKDRSIPRTIASFAAMRTNPQLTAAAKLASAVKDLKVSPQVEKALVTGFKSGQSLAQLLARVPTAQRRQAAIALANPAFWSAPAAVTVNALAPAKANTNALAQ